MNIGRIVQNAWHVCPSNVPYTIEGLWTGDRLAQEFYSYCAVSVPDYVNGSNGSPGPPTVGCADSTDIRITGCRRT